MKKQKEAAIEEGKSEQQTTVGLDANIITLEEFNFPHAIALHESALKAEPLISTYKKLYMSLGLDQHPCNIFVSSLSIFYYSCWHHLVSDSEVDVHRPSDWSLHPPRRHARIYRWLCLHGDPQCADHRLGMACYCGTCR